MNSGPPQQTKRFIVVSTALSGMDAANDKPESHHGWRCLTAGRATYTCVRLWIFASLWRSGLLGYRLDRNAVGQTSGVRDAEFPLGMIGNGRTAAVAQLEPLATFTGFDFQGPKGMKNRRVVPKVGKIILRQAAGQKLSVLQKRTGVYVSFR
jgi:hypothetical protein